MNFFMRVLFVGLLAVNLFPYRTDAATLAQDSHTIVKAKVVEIVSQKEETLPGTEVLVTIQSLRVRVLEGAEKGEEITFDNDYYPLKQGQTFYLSYIESEFEGTSYYAVFEPYRLPWLYFFVGLFIVCVLIFGGVQGLRGLISLAASLFFILYLLLPGVLQGFSPLLVSLGVSSLIIVLGSYVTHGFNKTTTAAVVGMIGTVLFTGCLAVFAVHVLDLTGYSSEEAVYLNFNTEGTIDFVGLLLGGIMIGLLGVLYDVAIGQAISVEELHRIAPHVPRKAIYGRALRIGREHIGALVNTLAIAYVGASLPLLLLFLTSGGEQFSLVLNREIFSTEIIRILIGSIGLVLAVPITTLISVVTLIKSESTTSDEKLNQEIEALSKYH